MDERLKIWGMMLKGWDGDDDGTRCSTENMYIYYVVLRYLLILY